MAKVGRPTVMTEETLRKLEEVFAIGGSDSEACFYADISKESLYAYCREHPEFTDRKESLKENPILKARQTVMKSLDDPKHAKWYLERKKKDEFSVRIENEHTGEDIITKLDEQNKKTKELIEEWQNANNSKQCDSQESDSGPEASPTSDNGDRQVNDAGPSESV